MKRRRVTPWSRFVLRLAPDVVGLLTAQARVSLDALVAFERWSSAGSTDDAARVHALEHDADTARVAVVAALRTALATPIDQEDLYVLSERCDHVVNSAKNIVSEAEALSWSPDAHASAMAGHLRAGMAGLVEGFSDLVREPDRAGEAADHVVSEARAIEHTYRAAMAELLHGDDLRAAFTTRELYRSYARSADLLVGVADRLWYSVLSGS